MALSLEVGLTPTLSQHAAASSAFALGLGPQAPDGLAAPTGPAPALEAVLSQIHELTRPGPGSITADTSTRTPCTRTPTRQGSLTASSVSDPAVASSSREHNAARASEATGANVATDPPQAPEHSDLSVTREFAPRIPIIVNRTSRHPSLSPNRGFDDAPLAPASGTELCSAPPLAMHSSTLAHPESLLSVSNLGALASTRTAVPRSTSTGRTDDTSSSDLSPLAGELFLPTTDTEPPVPSLAAATATAAPPREL
ncbi:unnamed protein product [Laminaria digitata]